MSSLSLLKSLILLEVLNEKQLKNFNVEEFKNIPYKEKLQFLNDHYIKIGEGSSRFVYDVGSGWALKFAINKKGIAQNSEEATVCTGDNKQLQDLFPKIKDIGPNYEWLVVQLASPMNSNVFEHLTKISYYEFLGGMLGAFDLENATTQQTEMASSLFKTSKFFSGLVEIIRSCGYKPGDLLRIDSWGVINNKPVIVDSGLTNAVYHKFYEHKTLSENYVVKEADYPQGFNVQTFKSLKSFSQRVKYAKEHLGKLGQGSARIALLADPATVIKIARNNKGVAQNRVEIDASNIGYEHIAEIKDYDQVGLWLEVERAERITPSQFKQLTGLNLQHFYDILYYWYVTTMQAQRRSYIQIPPEYDDWIETNFFVDLTAMIGNHDMMVADMQRISSWGMVTRNGKKVPVLIDYGLTKDVYKTYYYKPNH